MGFHMNSLVGVCLTFPVESYQSDISHFRPKRKDIISLGP